MPARLLKPFVFLCSLQRGNVVDAPAESKKLRYLLLVTAALLPCMFFFFLVNQNQGYLPLIPCLFVGGAFALAGLLIYVVFAWFVKTRLVLFTVILPAWALFFSYGTLYTALSMKNYPAWAKPAFLLLALLCAFVLLSLLLRLFKSKTPFLFLSLIVFFVFAFNFVSVVIRGVALERSRQALYEDGLAECKIKTDFFVQDGAVRPDIYWFHMDGMMSMKNVEKYFGDPQEELAAALQERGFVLNKNAYLHAGCTALAIPALMCPDYYDHVQWIKLEEYAASPNSKGMSAGFETSPKDVLARQNNELLHAFSAAGYEINTIASGGIYFYPMHRYYSVRASRPPQVTERTVDAGQWQSTREYQREAELQALADLLEKATMLPQLHVGSAKTLDDMDDRSVLSEHLGGEILCTERALLDVLQRGTSPKFVVVMNMVAHVPFRTDENGAVLPAEITDIDRYLPNQKYGDKIMLEMIDFVLESDPEAIIVLQSDHGMQTMPLEDAMRSRGFTDEQIIQVQNGVFSAVRIPPKWGGIPDELLPLDPRNISRLLVNQFVGENYAYLQ